MHLILISQTFSRPEEHSENEDEEPAPQIIEKTSNENQSLDNLTQDDFAHQRQQVQQHFQQDLSNKSYLEILRDCNIPENKYSPKKLRTGKKVLGLPVLITIVRNFLGIFFKPKKCRLARL